MPPYRLLTWGDLGTTATLLAVLQAHEVADTIDEQRARDEDSRMRFWVALIRGGS